VSLKDQLTTDSSNPVVVGVRLGTGALATSAAVWLVIAGGMSHQLGLVVLGIVMFLLRLAAPSRGHAGLLNSSSSMRRSKRLLPTRS
jgi:hypothetical protein